MLPLVKWAERRPETATSTELPTRDTTLFHASYKELLIRSEMVRGKSAGALATRDMANGVSQDDPDLLQ